MALLKSAIKGAPSRNNHAHVVNELGRAIVAGRYTVGQILPGDAELVEQFGVSRTVLREAMKTLAAKGLIVARARVGTRVTERAQWNLFDGDVLSWFFEGGADREFLHHLSDMRLGFEPGAARLAALRASKETIARMNGFVEEMSQATTNEAFAMADLSFHLALLEASGNPFMHSVGTLIEAALATTFQISSPANEPQERALVSAAHGAIVKAIAKRDPDAAAKATVNVITAGRDRVADQLAP
ncbi:MAG: DNA-binding FadR family transcriptional regulator [Halocynthiibacter sp.]|jgi:DNA-binding FadR family transcriptional regulator